MDIKTNHNEEKEIFKLHIEFHIIIQSSRFMKLKSTNYYYII